MLSMPVRHPELSLPDGSHEVTAEGFSHSRISPTVYTTFGTRNTHIEDPQQPHKRRRLQPLRQGPVNRNARFDRMLERVNILPLVTPQESSSPSRRYTSSISGSSEAAPPTPVDAYGALEGGRLGDGFLVFKARRGKVEQISSEPSRSRSPLPSWLSQTFATLEPHNPLRKLAAHSDATHIAGSPTHDETIDHSIDFRSQLKHDGDEDAGKLTQDNVFAFCPPPSRERFITDASSPLTNLSAPGRSLLPSLFCGSGAPESCNAERDSDNDVQQPLASGYLTSLLEISPTSRPFGTPGPAFYPAITILPSPLISSDTEALASFTANSSPHRLSSRLVFRDAIGPEVTSSQEDMTVGLLDHASPELSLSPEIIGYSGPIDDDYDDDECVFFKEGTHDLDGDRLVMPDVPEDRYMPLVGLERPYFGSPSEPLGIDVEFSFARAPHAATPATNGLKSPLHQFVKQTMTAMSCCTEENPERPPCVSPLITAVSSVKADGSDSVRSRDFIGGNSGQLFDTNASSGLLTQDVDSRSTAGDQVLSGLYTLAYFPQLPPQMFSKSESMRSTVPEQAVLQRQDMITDQPYNSLGSATCTSPPYSFNPHFSSIIAKCALETADTRGEDGKYWRLGNPDSYSAHITNDDWEEYEHDSDKENKKPMLIADHVSNTAVTSTFKSHGSDPGTELHLLQESHFNSPTADNPSLPHTPKRQQVVQADSIVSDDARLSLQVDVEMKLSLPARAFTPANEPRTPSSKRISTTQIGEQDDDALYWSKFSHDSIACWGDFDNLPGSKYNDDITSKSLETQALAGD